MRETMGELLAMDEGRLAAMLREAQSSEDDPVTRKLATIAALGVLLGEPRKASGLSGLLDAARRKLRQDGN